VPKITAAFLDDPLPALLAGQKKLALRASNRLLPYSPTAPERMPHLRNAMPVIPALPD